MNDRAEPQTSFLGKFSWATFDWANQPYYTLVTTFIFAPYFATGFIGDPVKGQEYWGYTQALAGLLIALISPVLGAIADSMGQRKPFLRFFALVFSLAAWGLWLAVPGDSSAIFPVMACLVIMAMTMEICVVFNNAMLPGLVPSKTMGRWSGFAWGWGYLGGLAALFFVLLTIAVPALGEAPAFLKTISTDQVLFGLDPEQEEHNRIVGPLAAVWFLIFLIPLTLFTPDQKSTGKRFSVATREGIDTLLTTLRQIRKYENIVRFLIARMLYADGLSAIFAFGGIYGAGTFGWEITELLVLGVLLSVFGAVGVFSGAFLDDFLGSKKTIYLSLGVLLTGVCGAFSVTPESAFFIYSLEPPSGEGLFASAAEQIYLGFVILIGMSGGPLQSASRTMLGRIAPMEMMTEFYGLYAMSGKATAFLAPLAIAFATAAFESQRLGFLPVLVFLVAGLILFIPVREERTNKAG